MYDETDDKLPQLKGAGGALKGGGGNSTAPDTLFSTATVKLVDLIGEGEIGGIVGGLKGVYLNDVPVQNADGTFNFKGLTAEFRNGTPDQDYMAGYPEAQNTQNVGVRALQNVPVTVSVTDPSTDRVRVTLFFPSLFVADDKGTVSANTVTYAIYGRYNGGPLVNLSGDQSLTGKTSSGYYKSHEVTLPKNPSGASAPWQVSLYRLSPNDDPSANTNDKYTRQSDVVFSSATTIIDAKLSYPNTAIVGLTAQAQAFGSSMPTRAYLVDGHLMEVPANYDPSTRTYRTTGVGTSNGLWDGTFKRAVSDNPAWALYLLLSDKRFGLGGQIDAASIDKWTLYDIGRYCDVMVPDGKGGQEPRYTFNAVIQTQEDAFELLQLVAQVFRGMPLWSSGSVTAVQDRPRDPVLLVTESNVEDGEFSYSSSSLQARHTVALVTWKDPTNLYKTQIEAVEDEEGVRRYGYNPTNIDLLGCTSRGQAQRAGKWVLFTELKQTQVVGYRAGLDHAVIRPGDVVAVQDPSIVGVGDDANLSGRLEPGTTSTLLVLDHPVVMVSGGYTASVVLPDGTVQEVAVSNGAGTRSSLNVAQLRLTPDPGAVWLVAGPVKPRLFSVVSIHEDEPHIYAVVALQYEPGKYATIDTGASFTPTPFSDFPNIVTPPKNLQVRESSYRELGVLRQALTLSWTMGESLNVSGYYVTAINPFGDVIPLPRRVSTSADFRDVISGEWSFFVVTEGLNGRMSTPSDVYKYTVRGWSQEQLPTVSNLRVRGGGLSFVGRSCTMEWDDTYPTGQAAYPVAHVIMVYDVNTNTLVLREQVGIGEKTWTFDYEKNRNSGGPRRRFRVSVAALSQSDRLGDFTSVTVSNPAPAQVDLSLTATTETVFINTTKSNDPDFAGTLIWVSQTAGFNPLATPVTIDTGLDFAQFAATPQTTYYVRVAPYDAFSKVPSELNISVERSINVSNRLIDVNPPGTPQNLQLTSSVEVDELGQVSAKLSATWNQVTDTNLGFYEVQVAPGADPTEAQFDRAFEVVPNLWQLTNQRPGVQVTARVRAWNAQRAASSPWSNPVTVTLAKNTVAPGAVTGLVGTAGFESALLSWTNPTNRDLALLEIWQSATTNFANATKVATVSAPDNTARISLATVGDARFWVNGVNSSGLAGTRAGPVTVTTSALVGAQLASGIVDATKFASNLAANLIVASIPTTNVAPYITLSTTGQLYRWDVSLGQYVKTVAAGDIQGDIVRSQLANNIIDFSAFATDLEPIRVVSTLPTVSGYTGPRVVRLTTDNKLYRYTGTAWVSTVPAGDITGSIAASQIAALEASKITGQLSDTQIAAIAAAKVSGQLTNAQIAALDGAKITGAITEATLAATKITGQLVASQLAAIEASKITGTLADTQIAALAASKITGTLTDAQIAALDAAKLTGTLASGVGVPTGNLSGSITNDQIAALAAAKITGTIVATQIADAAISTAKLAAGLSVIERVTTLPTSGNFEGRVVYLTTTNKLYRHDGTNWLSSVPATDIAGQIADTQVAAIAASKITGALSDAQIAALDASKLTGTVAAGVAVPTVNLSGAITSDQIASLAATKLAGAIVGTQITDGAISTAKLAAGSVTTEKIVASSITGDHIAANSISARKLLIAGIAANLVPVGEFLDRLDGWDKSENANYIVASGGPSGAPYLRIDRGSASSVTSFNVYTLDYVPIEGGSVYEASCALRGPVATSTSGFRFRVLYYDTNKAALSPSSIDVWGSTQPLTTSWVDLSKQFTPPAAARFFRVMIYHHTESNVAVLEIANIAIRRPVSATLIEDGAIVTGKIAANAVTATQIAAGSITTAKIAANAVTATQIAAATITATEIAAGTIRAANIQAGTITSLEIAAGTIKAYNILAGTITANEIATNTITANEIKGGTITAAEIAANTITASRLVLGDSTNIIQNPTFTAFSASTSGMVPSTDTWLGPTAVPATDARVPTGAPTVNVAYRASPNVGTVADSYTSWFVPVVPGETYYLAADVAAFADVTSSIALYVRRFNADRSAGSPTGPAPTAGSSNTALVGTESWVSLQGTYTVPAGIYWLWVGLRLSNRAASGDPIRGGWAFTNVRFRKTASAELIVDGAITADKIAVNAVTAGKVAANAITANEIVAGSILASKLAVASNNLALNGDLSLIGNISGAPYLNYTMNAVSAGGLTFSMMALPGAGRDGYNALRMGAAGTASSGSVNYIVYFPTNPAGVRSRAPVTGGQVYEISYYGTAQACLARAIVNFYNSAGAIVGQTTTTLLSLDARSTGPLSGRVGGFVTAPATAVTAHYYARFDFNTGAVDPSLTISQFMVAAALPSQTELSPFIDPGITAISGGTLITNSITATQIAASTITATEIAAAAITTAKLATGAVTADQIAANAVTAAKILAGSIQTAHMVAGSIDADRLVAASITAGQIAADAITAAKIAAGAVVTEALAAGAVTAAKIVAGAIQTAHMTAGSINADRLIAASILADQIAASAITTEKLNAGSITAAKIAAGAITADAIAANAITTTHLSAGSITTAKIAAGAVTATEIGANQVTTAKIATGAVTANEIAANAITATKILAGSIQTDKLAANAVTASKLYLTDTQNLLLNGDFLQPITEGWTQVGFGGSTVTVVTGNDLPAGAPSTQAALLNRTTVSGSAIILLHDNGLLSTTVASFGTPCAAGDVFYAEAWVYTDVVQNVSWNIYTRDATNGAYTARSMPTDLVTLPVGEWRRVSGVANVLVNGRAQFRITNAAGGSKLYVANVKLRKMDGANLIVDGAITARMLKLGPAFAPNLCHLGDMLDGVQAWNINENTAFASIVRGLTGDVAGPGGTPFIRINRSGVSPKTVASPATTNVVQNAAPLSGQPATINMDPCEGGTVYEVSAWIRSDVVDTVSRVYVRIYFYQDSGTSTSSVGASTSSLGLSGSIETAGVWKRISTLMTFPANARFFLTRLDQTVASASANVDYAQVAVKKAINTTIIQDDAITTGKIVANAITAAKINVDEVFANTAVLNKITTGVLVAGAIKTDMLDASIITAGKLAVGLNTGNLLWNSDQALDNWWAVYPVTGGLSGMNTVYALSGTRAFFLRNSGAPTSGTFFADFQVPTATDRSNLIPIQSNQTYELSAYLSVHRCLGSIELLWINASGTEVSRVSSQTLAHNNMVGGPTDAWRARLIAVAPATAVNAIVRLVQTYNGGSNSHVFGSGFYLGAVPAGTTAYSAYAPQGRTLIDGGQLRTNSLSADRITSGTITTDQLSADSIDVTTVSKTGKIKVDKLEADVLTATNISVGSNANDKLTNLLVGTSTTKISGVSLSTGTVSADKVHVGLRQFATTSEFQIERSNGALTNVIAVSAGVVTYQADNGLPATASVSALRAAYPSANTTLYLYWDRTNPSVYQSTTSATVANAANCTMLATFNSQTGLTVLKGGIILDGTKLTARSASFDIMTVNAISAFSADIQTATINKLYADKIEAKYIATGTLAATTQVSVGSDRVRIEGNTRRYTVYDLAGNPRFFAGYLGTDYTNFADDNYGMAVFAANGNIILQSGSTPYLAAGYLAGVAPVDAIPYGPGQNLQFNSGFMLGAGNVNLSASGGHVFAQAVLNPGDTYNLVGGRTLGFNKTTTESFPIGQNCDAYFGNGEGRVSAFDRTQFVPCDPGQRFEASAYVNGHRCNAQVLLVFLDFQGNIVGSFGSTIIAGRGTTGFYIDQYDRLVVFGVAPVGAIGVRMIVRLLGTGGGSPYLFVTNIYLGVAAPSQTLASPYVPSGQTAKITPFNASTFIDNASINNAQIADATITNAKIANATIIEAKIADLNVTSAKIANGAVGNLKIGDAAITNAKIQNLEVTNIKIAGQAVTQQYFAYSSGVQRPLKTSVTIVLRGTGPVLIQGYFDGNDNYRIANPNTGRLYIYRNGAEIKSFNHPYYLWRPSGSDTEYGLTPCVMAVVDNPGAGTFTYEFASNSSHILNPILIVVTELSK